MGLLDLIFPKYCVSCKKLGEYLCPDCFAYLSFDTPSICLVCNRASIDGLTHPSCLKKDVIDGSFTAILFRGTAKKLIYQFKYKPYLTNLEKVLSDLFYEALIQKEEFNRILTLKPILVPIPLFSARLKKRGYNQAEILANELASRLELRAENLLERIKDTKSQVGLSKVQRKENISGCFSVRSKKLEVTSGKSFFLVDDVLTSGATFLEAGKMLKKTGAKKVYALALAKD